MITELAVFAIDKKAGGARLVEIAPGVNAEELRGKTDADYANGSAAPRVMRPVTQPVDRGLAQSLSLS